MLNIAFIEPQNIILSNGLAVSLAGDFNPAKPYSAIVFLAKCGLYTESEDNNGITHALEHILFKGSRKYSNYEITSIINGFGGSIDAFTTADSLGIEIQIPHERISEALEVLSQLALYPAFPENEIELEKKVIIEEMRFYKDDPEDLVMLKLEKFCYKDSCYSREILGTPASVNRIDAVKLKRYHGEYFTPSNCSLTIAGAFNPQKIIKAAEKFFGNDMWKSANSPDKNDNYLDAAKKNEYSKHIVIKKEKFMQDYYAAGFLTPSSIENEHICSLLLPYVFSSLKSSPLLYMLKDEYNAAASLTTDLIFKYGMWMLTVLVSSPPSKTRMVKAAINSFISNISKFVGKKYFESIKKCFLLDYLQEIENPKTYCNELSTFNHILGYGSYNRTAASIIALEYENFFSYLESHIENRHYNSVELMCARPSKHRIICRGITSLLKSIERFDTLSINDEPEKNGIIKQRTRFFSPAGENLKNARIAQYSRTTLCSLSDPAAEYSTLTLFIAGGTAGSLKIGDANIFAELFGKKTFKKSMHENYMLSDSMGIYFDCNSYLDYFKFEAATAGEWNAEKISYLDSLFSDFHFNSDMLIKARSAVKNTVKSIHDDVFELSFWGFLTNLFRGSSYQKALFANEKKLTGIKGEDILNYYHSVIASPFISAAVSSPGPCERIIIDNFKSFLFQNSCRGSIPLEIPPEPERFEKEIKSRQEQCTIVIGSPAPAFGSSDSTAFSIANHILSDYAGKRLWNIRENHGLCYNIFSEYIPLKATGAFFCYANTANDRIELTGKKITEEILRFAEYGPDKTELDNAVTQLIKRFENSAAYSSTAARMIGQHLFYEKTAEPCFNYIEKLKNLTCENIRDTFIKYCGPERISFLKITAEK